MEDTERQRILSDLRAGHDALRHAITDVDETLAAMRPATERWSTLECVEHIAIVEAGLYIKLLEAAPNESVEIDAAREQRIARSAIDRTRTIEAPEMAHPAGRFTSVSEAFAAFETRRAKTLCFVENFDADPRAMYTTHPRIPGPVNCYETLLLMALHPLRHAKQIEENRATQERTSNEESAAAE